MAGTEYDVVAIGNAIVDVIARADDAFLVEKALAKGSMQLLFTPEEAEALYADMGSAIEASGGSAANTVAGISALGGKCGFIGQVADDTLGKVFEHDIRSLGVSFTTPRREPSPPSARCLILVTPDAQRTMNTYLGASRHLSDDALDLTLIEKAAILYLEGYLWDAEEPKAAMRKAIDTAKAAGRKVAFTLSDSFCIERHRADFLALLADGKIDILFANEAEITSLYETEDFDAAVARGGEQTSVLVVTRGEKGALAIVDGARYEVPASPVENVVDTTGAGDLFAAGFLAGYVQSRSITDSLSMGAICAAEIISHYGARPEQDLQQLVREQIG